MLYDHQTFSLQDYGGISKVFGELFNGVGLNALSAEVSVLLSNNLYLKDLPGSSHFSFFKNSNFDQKQSIIYAVNRAYSIYKLRNGNYNVFHPTYYDPYFLKYLNKKPFVVTYHDLTHEIFGERFQVFSKDKSTVNGKKILIHHASKVIAVSNSTKNDIVRHYGIDEKLVKVIYLGNSFNTVSKPRAAANKKERYLLFVGNRDYYKNFIFFLQTIAGILKATHNLKLICAGGGKFSNEENLVIGSLQLHQQVVQVRFSDQETLKSLYANALIFVFPSLYEGFGIPLLESFSCGCPVAASNRGSLPEIAIDAAIYFDPEDQNSTIDAVVRLIDDESLRSDLIRKGYDRLKFFSWQLTCKQTYELYRSVI